MPLSVQTPTTAVSGIAFTGGSPAMVTAFTTGFLFCANVGTPGAGITLASAHEDQSFSPSHPWKFSTAVNDASLTYSTDGLSINTLSPNSPTLNCAARGPSGETAFPTFGDEIFADTFDALLLSSTVQFPNMVNWIPPSEPAFSWTTPDWTQVPANACDSTALPRVTESVACAGVSGVRPGASGPPVVRAATMWTASDGVSFTYMFRVDATFGSQGPSQFRLPTLASTSETDASTAEWIALSDAYDASFLNGSGQFCYRATLPTVLNSSVCTGQTTYSLPMETSRANLIVVQAPPVGSGSTSFYVAVNRPIGQSSHANAGTPVVAAAVLIDPALAAEGGNKFKGDDVVFGFIPTSTGFPWMPGQ
jgi:hypothetical protein